jgi:hypothetical protein
MNYFRPRATLYSQKYYIIYLHRTKVGFWLKSKAVMICMKGIKTKYCISFYINMNNLLLVYNFYILI